LHLVTVANSIRMNAIPSAKVFNLSK
jgi:hypothetical protein